MKQDFATLGVGFESALSFLISKVRWAFVFVVMSSFICAGCKKERADEGGEEDEVTAPEKPESSTQTKPPPQKGRGIEDSSDASIEKRGAVGRVEPTPLKENPLEALSPFVKIVTKGMTKQLRGAPVEEAYENVTIHEGDENRFAAFMSVVKLAGFKAARGVVLGFDLYFFKGEKNVLVVKVSTLLTGERAVLVDLKAGKGRPGIPKDVFALSKFSGGLIHVKEAAMGLSKVLSSSSCGSLPVAGSEDVSRWFPPGKDAQLAEELKRLQRSLGRLCAEISSQKWEEVRVRMDNLNYLVVGEEGKPEGQIQLRFAPKSGKPALSVQGKVRSFRPIGVRR